MSDDISKNLWSAGMLKYMILTTVQVGLKAEMTNTQSEEVGFPISVVGESEEVFRKLKVISTYYGSRSSHSQTYLIKLKVRPLRLESTFKTFACHHAS